MDEFQRLVEAMQPGAMLVQAEPLTGGVSARVTRLDVAWPDGSGEQLVVRQHGPRDLAARPDVAGQEFRLLSGLHRAGLPVPRPRHLSPAGEAFPTPALVTEFVEGAALDLAEPDALSQLARFLSTLHALPAQAFQFFPLLPDISPPPDSLDESLSEGLIRATLKAYPLPESPLALLHGDFWPDNTLWRSGRLAAVIDWENACLGAPLSDVSNARLELLWVYGEAAVEQFSAAYGVADSPALAYWDLRAALRPAGRLEGWGLGPEVLDLMRARHRRFVEAACARLTVPG